MQCPSCGFENIPGRQDCAVCSKPLVASGNRESVIPPRAKDSSLIERIRWRLSRSRTVTVAHERAHNASRAYKAEYTRTNDSMPSPGYWMTTRNAWFSLFNPNEEQPDIIGRLISLARFEWLLWISTIPGFGYIFGRRDTVTGRRHILAALCALLLALLTYKTYIADALLCGIIVLSVISVCVAAYSVRPPTYYRWNGLLFARMTIGAALVPCVALFLYYTTLTACVVGHGLFSVNNQALPPPNTISQNDRLLLWYGNPYNLNAFSRGDIIVSPTVNGKLDMGVVLGIPGDSVQTTQNGDVYLNGKTLNLSVQNLTNAGKYSIQSYPDRIIPNGEYLIYRSTTEHPDQVNLQSSASLAYFHRQVIFARVVAVTYPPSHRKIIRSYHQ